MGHDGGAAEEPGGGAAEAAAEQRVEQRYEEGPVFGELGRRDCDGV